MKNSAVISIIALQCIGMITSAWIPKDKVYHIENDLFLPREEASKFCQKVGMQLLSVKSKTEFQRLKLYINDKYGYIPPYWIGAYKDCGVFKWSAYNEVIEPSKMMWHPGEPNNKTGNELCVHTWADDFDWNDNDCRLKLPFICELQLDILPEDIKEVTLGIRIGE